MSALSNLASRIIAWSSTVAGALASLLLVVFGGIYLAINPRLYRDGLVKLVPPALQPNVSATLDDAGEALKRWLAGQLIAMLLVGACTAAGLWLAGVPSAIALGLIAGLAEFVPIIGPILAAIPALLIASTQDWQTVLLALAVFVVVQQVESNLIAPLIVDRMVSIAPAVGLFAVVAMGVLNSSHRYRGLRRRSTQRPAREKKEKTANPCAEKSEQEFYPGVRQRARLALGRRCGSAFLLSSHNVPRGSLVVIMPFRQPQSCAG